MPQKSGADHEKNFLKKLEKALDKKKRKWYNIKAVSQERAAQKKLLKKLEKVLDKQFWMWYNIKAARKGNGNSILKIEQYKEKYNDPWNSFVIKMKESQEKDLKKHK